MEELFIKALCMEGLLMKDWVSARREKSGIKGYASGNRQ